MFFHRRIRSYLQFSSPNVFVHAQIKFVSEQRRPRDSLQKVESKFLAHQGNILKYLSLRC